MAAKRQDDELADELLEMLEEDFAGITVKAGYSKRWDRRCVTFRWAGFEGLLPEERFQRLATYIPEDFRKETLSGFVWLELTPDETIDTFLKLPRSEDVADKEGKITGDLYEASFFEALAESLGPKPQEGCPGDFSLSHSVLEGKGFSPRRIHEAKLVFIRHGAYCDCQVLQSVRSALRELHTEVT
ncbi:MAG: hypothetical protein JSU63_12210 [Phycisphaerales bacterium]|nr:MAG: hypothetical protein JSU63_12210 [Phycisphaerales bacterium]